VTLSHRVRIRDPIHGTIAITDEEKAVIDSRLFQRLRSVRQLGFGELAYPGATHTRHAHSIGAMHVASRLLDAVLADAGLDEKTQSRFRAAVRAAVLCHDLGHMPFSHASERIAPARSLLKLPMWLTPGGQDKQAHHEDFTARILLDSALTPIVTEAYAQHDVTPELLTSLISGCSPPGGIGFKAAGVDWAPLLRALVSGELDADRMDYLLRDSFYTGVNYGRYDLEWIAQNLRPAVKDGRAYLALAKAAAFAFEDFLLSRYHMFLSVYLHHTAVSFDWMLQRFYEEARGEFEIPADPEAFLECDDVALISALRRSKNPWAHRIATRQGFKRVVEFTERDAGYDLNVLSDALKAAGIEHFSVESTSALSKYAAAGESPPLYILDTSTGRLTEVARYTPLYQRYSGAVRLSRVYVRPDQVEASKPLVMTLTKGGSAK
jgi:HD superfamily phosphohydrolase